MSADNIIYYAWVGWITLMIPTICVLAVTAWGMNKLANYIAGRLMMIYRLESIRYYFDKMEKEGTHAFKIKPGESNE
jgi:hypothetical protein